MSLPDLETSEGRATYRAELKAVGRPFRLAGVALILLGAGYIVATRVDWLVPNQAGIVVAYAAVAAGWAFFVAATFLRTRHHRRRLKEGL
ncbi:MAG: hypothetical protein ACT6TH_03070 [Brevundimonas sp.]|uniref:hypothetical protein n=1 Tax=Brevundimonas sp. TaxID=1871086 RepID=UPI0040336E90